MHQKKNLRTIAEIITGYTFREAILEVPGGDLYVLQAKNIREESVIDHSKLTRTRIDTSHTKAFVEDGDVAIGSRGIFHAGVLKSNKLMLAASSVYLLRLRDKNSILPEYLATYLNSAAGKRKLAKVLTTGTIRTLLKKDLENIQIPVPSVEKQKKIISLDHNIRAQAKLLFRKIDAQKNIINGVLNQLERSLT